MNDFAAGITAGYTLAYAGAARVHLLNGNSAEALACLSQVPPSTVLIRVATLHGTLFEMGCRRWTHCGP